MQWSAHIQGTEGLEGEMLAAVLEGTQAGLEALGVKGAEMVQENIATPYNGQPPAVAFGNLEASVVSAFQREATMCTEIIGVSPAAGADVYAAPVETGSRPHMPPVSALVPWVQKKFRVESEKQALSIAFAIARRMRTTGTGGHFMFIRALERLQPMSVPILEHELGAALAAHGFTGGAI